MEVVSSNVNMEAEFPICWLVLICLERADLAKFHYLSVKMLENGIKKHENSMNWFLLAGYSTSNFFYIHISMSS